MHIVLDDVLAGATPVCFAYRPSPALLVNHVACAVVNGFNHAVQHQVVHPNHVKIASEVRKVDGILVRQYQWLYAKFFYAHARVVHERGAIHENQRTRHVRNGAALAGQHVGLRAGSAVLVEHIVDEFQIHVAYGRTSPVNHAALAYGVVAGERGVRERHIRISRDFFRTLHSDAESAARCIACGVQRLVVFKKAFVTAGESFVCEKNDNISLKYKPKSDKN